MQKTYTPDFLIGKQEKNRGQLTMYLVDNAHEPIIERELFERVQRMKGQINDRRLNGESPVLMLLDES